MAAVVTPQKAKGVIETEMETLSSLQCFSSEWFSSGHSSGIGVKTYGMTCSVISSSPAMGLYCMSVPFCVFVSCHLLTVHCKTMISRKKSNFQLGHLGHKAFYVGLSPAYWHVAIQATVLQKSQTSFQHPSSLSREEVYHVILPKLALSFIVLSKIAQTLAYRCRGCWV